MAPRRMVLDSIGFAAAQFVVRATIIARTIVAARLLGPSVFGAWNALQLLMDYGALAPLGAQQGLDQLVPRRLAERDTHAEDRLKRAGFTFILVLSLLYASACLAYFSNSTGKLVSYWGVGGLLLAMLIVIQLNWATYATGVLRSHGNMTAVSRWYFVQGVLGALAGLALIPWLGGWGLLWGWLAGTLIAFSWTLWTARHLAPIRPLVVPDGAALFRVGFPLFFFNGSALVIRNLDRLIILRYLGTSELGYYSLAVTALTLVMYLPDSATFVFYPRLVQRFQECGRRPELVRDSVLRLLTLLTVLTPALGGVAFVFVRDVVGVLLPRFFPGAQAVQVMCFTASALAVSTLASIVLMTLERQLWLIPLAVVFTGAFAMADVVALQQHRGITGVAWATLITYVVMGATALILMFHALGLRPRQAVARLAASYWGLAVALVLAPLAQRLAPWANGMDPLPRILHAVVGSATFLLGYAVLVGPLLRGIGLRQLVAELNIPWLARRWGRDGDTGPTSFS